MYTLDGFLVTLKDSNNVVRNYYKNTKDFVGLWDLTNTMCSIAMDFKVIYPDVHVQYVNL
jgi:hypothetical protein